MLNKFLSYAFIFLYWIIISCSYALAYESDSDKPIFLESYDFEILITSSLFIILIRLKSHFYSWFTFFIPGWNILSVCFINYLITSNNIIWLCKNCFINKDYFSLINKMFNFFCFTINNFSAFCFLFISRFISSNLHLINLIIFWSYD